MVAVRGEWRRPRRDLLARYGAEIILTPAIEGMTGAVYAAQELISENPQYFMPQQFENPANPEAHRRTTAREILAATGGRLDALVAGAGTGGPITRGGHGLQAEKTGAPGTTPIQGIAAGFAPGVLNREVLDEIMSVSDEDAIVMSRRLSKEEGLLVGISAGANVVAALKVAKRLGRDKRVVTVLPDTGERYLTMEA